MYLGTYIFPGIQYSYLFNDVTHVCAGYDARVAKDTCYGDSGAPLMVQLSGQWFVYGNNSLSFNLTTYILCSFKIFLIQNIF